MDRANKVSAAILRAVSGRGGVTTRGSVLGRILFFFSVFNIALERYDAETFERLRGQVWHFDEEQYRESFAGDGLEPAGDLGYSGSTFFTTRDGKYLIKSIPRRSEYKFFAQELLHPYERHMSYHPASMLVRITDFLHAPSTTLGAILRITPAHHIIMENILYGQEVDPQREKWETYDLKPVSYFYPERDLAGGHLASDAVKERILDTFDDKVRVSQSEMNDLLEQLSKDSALLEACNVVDYSLFLIRYPAATSEQRDVPSLQSRASPWRTGVTSSDKKWTYRAIVLDFFWAKHQPHAKAMTLLIRSFNMVGGKGHMSITTDAADYRKRFLSMAESLFDTRNTERSTET